jgi:predicted permease
MLGLAIGPTAAIFNIAEAILFRVLPVRNPQELVLLKWDITRSPAGMIHTGHDATLSEAFSFPMFQRLEQEKQVFTTIFGFAPLGFTHENLVVYIDGQANTANGVMVTGEYFSGLGVTPILGRGINDGDEAANSARVAVISYGYWQRVFGGDLHIIGRKLLLNTIPFEVVGVAPPGFSGLEATDATDMWIPAQESSITPWGAKVSPGESMFRNRKWWWLTIVGRLRRGVDKNEAQARLNQLFQSSILAEFKPQPDPQSIPALELASGARGTDTLRQRFSKPLLALMTLSLLLLAIACFNLAMLLLGRTIGRRREMGVRIALGGARRQLIVQMFTEYGLIAVLGAIVGLFLVFVLSRIPVLASSVPVPVQIDLPILAITSGVSILTLMIFGSIPIIWTTNINVTSVLNDKAEMANLGGRYSHRLLSRILVISEVAISIVLLMAAGVLSRTFSNLVHQDLGFDSHELLLFHIDGTKLGYNGNKLADLYLELEQRLANVPGVKGVSFSGISLVANNRNAGPISILSYRLAPGQSRIVQWNDVGPGFFETMGITIMSGRGIDDRDMVDAPRVAVISLSLAHYFFGSSNPMGQRFNLNRAANIKDSYEVIGVVRDAKYETIKTQAPRTVYIPFKQKPFPVGSVDFVLRCRKVSESLVADLRDAVRSVESRLPVSDVRTQDEQIADAIFQEMLLARLATCFSLLALLFTTLGVFGILSSQVSQRSREIAVRIAMGAQSWHIVRMVLRETALLIGAGIACGVPCAIAANRAGSALLYGVAPAEPIIAIYATMLTSVIALVASLAPVLRAVRTDTNINLRSS